MRVKFASCVFLAVFLFLAVFPCSWAAGEKGGGNMKVSSPDFTDKGSLPRKFTIDGKGVNPALDIEDIPEGTQSLVLIMDDPDAPSGTFTHWVVYDIPVVSSIDEDSIPGKQGLTTARGTKYVSPAPPSGTHRYIFKVFALDKKLDLPEGISRQMVEKAMEGHIIEQAQITSLYKRGESGY
jgi:Raf kinase inhibitor-like YbhB/YbcL family protein